jgi:hypothetical protein
MQTKTSLLVLENNVVKLCWKLGNNCYIYKLQKVPKTTYLNQLHEYYTNDSHFNGGVG